MEITINTQEVANELERSYEQELIQIAIRYNTGVNRFLSKFNSEFAREVKDLVTKSNGYKNAILKLNKK